MSEGSLREGEGKASQSFDVEAKEDMPDMETESKQPTLRKKDTKYPETWSMAACAEHRSEDPGYGSVRVRA